MDSDLRLNERIEHQRRRIQQLEQSNIDLRRNAERGFAHEPHEVQSKLNKMEHARLLLVEQNAALRFSEREWRDKAQDKIAECDALESEIEHLKAQHAEQVAHGLALAESLANISMERDQANSYITELVADRDALHDENEQLKKHAEDGWMAYKSKNLYPITEMEQKLAEAGTKNYDLRAERDALESENDRLREALERIARFDHQGFGRSAWMVEPMQDIARAALDQETP